LLRLRVQPQIQRLALSMVRSTLGWRQIGTDQILVDLGDPCLIGAQPVQHAAFDSLMLQLALRLKTMPAGD
jgi:hypothetical protein